MKYILVLLITASLSVQGVGTENIYDVSHLHELENVKPVVVIGAGPAGLAAALYAFRGGFDTVMFSAGKAGGQLLQSHLVENVLGYGRQTGKAIMRGKIEHIESFGIQIVPESITSVDVAKWPFTLQTDAGTTIHALALIVATGSTPRFLGVPGESEYLGHGVSTCADCDAHFFKGEDVVVVGGGDSAIISALVLAAFAKSVTLLNRSGKLRAAPTVLRHLNEYDTIALHMHKKVVEIGGQEEKLTHVIIEDTQTGEQSRLAVQGVFLAIGHTPHSGIFKGSVTTDVNGYIVLNGRSQHTSVPGVFAAGEVTVDLYRQVGVAEGDGAKAGIDAVAFLHEIGINEKIKQSLKLYHYEAPVEDYDDVDMGILDDESDVIVATAGDINVVANKPHKVR